MMTKDGFSGQEWKANGNKAFNRGDWSEALVCYTTALNLATEDDLEKAVFYKNRAAVYLKQEEYEKAVNDCNEALKITPSDPKALFRRCQALEKLLRFEEAYRDARHVVVADPGNKSIQPIVARLHEIVQERHKETSRIDTKVIHTC